MQITLDLTKLSDVALYMLKAALAQAETDTDARGLEQLAMGYCGQQQHIELELDARTKG